MKNIKTRLFALVMAAVMLAAAVSACEISIISKEGGPGDITISGGLPTPGGDMPTDSNDTTQPTNANLNPDLIGVWGGGWSGVSHYYHFRADGTYYYRNYHGGPSILFQGNWYESDGTIYFTNRSMIAFNSSDVPEAVEYLEWTTLDDDTMRIHLGVIGEDEYSSQDNMFRSDEFGLKYFYNFDIFDDGDGSLPRVYLSYQYDNAPNWAFPYKIFEYDTAGNFVGYADGYYNGK
ncbi:MAG: hypothetical protein FWH48_02025 [Oscillospiraceae bacterium]|nr:hypothetical protein [Oscillospiraceae bacterium]